jgi:LemA protein
MSFWKNLARFAAVAAIGVGLAGCGINSLPSKDENVKAAWSQVQNEYQRRADLVPNLVATVKGYAKQEQSVLVQVTEARAKATQTVLPPDVLTNPQAFQAYEQNQARLQTSLSRLLAISENYPDLKSNQNFIALQAQLEGTENRITVARRDYIAAVQEFNTMLRTIPTRWTASMFYPEMKPYQTFQANEKAQSAPSVQF